MFSDIIPLGKMYFLVFSVRSLCSWSQSVRHNHGRPQGVGQNGHLPPWKLGLRTKNFKKTRPKVYAADQKSADQIMLLTKSQQHNSD